jgi:hypothetical protein
VNDPTKHGRIRVSLPEIYGTADPQFTPWIYPLGYNSGLRLFNVPDLDTEVGVVFIKDFYTGFYGIGHYPKGQAKIFDQDYPNLYGFEDAQGNYFTCNKKTGEVIFHHQSGSEIKLDKDGNTEAKISGTLKVTISKDTEVNGQNIKVVSKNVDVSADNVNVNAKDVMVKASTAKIHAGKTELGAGGSPIARVGDRVQVGDKTGSIISGGTNTSI